MNEESLDLIEMDGKEYVIVQRISMNEKNYVLLNEVFQDELLDNTLYASFISLNLSSANLLEIFTSGLYFLSSSLYVCFISSILTRFVSSSKIL